jgi:hypothetical protein
LTDTTIVTVIKISKEIEQPQLREPLAFAKVWFHAWSNRGGGGNGARKRANSGMNSTIVGGGGGSRSVTILEFSNDFNNSTGSIGEKR